MEKLRHVEITEAIFDKQGIFEGSSKLENLRILTDVRFPTVEVDKVDVLLRRCPNLQQLHIGFLCPNDSEESFCLTLENIIQLQELHICFRWRYILSELQLPSNLKKLVLKGTYMSCPFPCIVGLPSLEYLQLELLCFPQGTWCLGDITCHKLKFLKLALLDISRWDASEESFPVLETLVIKSCVKLEEIPLSFADIPTLKQIELIGCTNKSLEDSAVRIKKEVEVNEGNDRIDLITIVEENEGNMYTSYFSG